MCFRDEAVILNETADAQRTVNIARRTNTVDGYETLAALVADTDPEVVWGKSVAKIIHSATVKLPWHRN